jgi:hypothetical protein
VGRRYALSGENLTLGTGSVLVAVQTAAAGAAGSLLRLLRVEVSQNATATLAMVRLALSTRTTAGTLTVTAATPRNLTLGGPASGIAGGTSPLTAATCGVNSSADTGGTYTDVWPVNPNNQGGWAWIPTPEERILVPPSTLFVARFLAAPASAAGWTVVVVWEEEE